MSILKALEERVLVADGAMGTMLLHYGLSGNSCLEQANLAQPELVQRIHLEYLAAGADLIETNTFGANRLRLNKYGLANKVHALNTAGVELAQAAARKHKRPVFIAGAVGPLGQFLAPVGQLSKDEAAEIYREQISALTAAGVDLVLFESMADPAEVELAVGVARELAPELPLACNMAFLSGEATLLGASVNTVFARLSKLPLRLMGVNCGSGPQDLYQVIQQVVAASQIPLMVAPNAGRPVLVEGRSLYLSTPTYFAQYAQLYLEQGVRVIGGCCGTTPAHIKAIAQVAKEGVTPQQIKPLSQALPKKHVQEVESAPKRENLLKRLQAKNVITVEIDPPKGIDIQKVLAGARALKEAGVDAVNIADSPMARVRMSPVALAHLLGEQVGMDAILHFTCRDRNLLGLQSELIGAAALGINNVLALTGDPPGIGDHPQATAVFDVNSEGLVNILQKLNQGQDLMGNPLGTKTNFAIGVAVSPAALDLDKEIARLEAKIKAGAHFIQTQPIFDPELWRRFAARIEGLGLPVLVGILPLRNARHAEFLHNEVPGIEIPAAIRQQLASAPAEEQAAIGIRIARALIQELRGEVAGFYLMPPFGHYETAIEIIRP